MNSTNTDRWNLPPDITIDEVNGLLQELHTFPSSFVGKLLRGMLQEKLNDNFAIILTDRNVTDEACRLRVSNALAKVDLLMLLTKD